MTTRIDYSIGEINDIVQGQWIQMASASKPAFLSLDSRKIPEPAKTIFWAIPGPNRDGAAFIKPLYEAGVRNFVTQKRISAKGLKDANIILVPDALDALQALAAHHRRRFPKLRVIAITGSNGKTIVKDWLSELLAKTYRVVKSPRSFNSQIGVALSVLQIRPEHEFAVFEAGISLPKEMERLEKMILPGTGIFTNIGTAHDEGFKNTSQKIDEKLKLFKHTKHIVFPDAGLLGDRIRKKFHHNKTLTGWCTGDCRLHIRSITKQPDKSLLSLSWSGADYQIFIPFTDDASIENAISVFGGLAVAGALTEAALNAFSLLPSVSMRLELKPGLNRCVIINDSYSNDLQSLGIALAFLKQQSHRNSTVILSDLLQSGLGQTELYEQVAAMLTQQRVGRLIGVGPQVSANHERFQNLENSAFFADTEALLAAAHQLDFRDEAILIKGARRFAFERISQRLEAHIHQTVLSVNLSNLAHNIRIYRTLLRPETKMMAMVKAFAYGTGSEQIGALLQTVGVDYLTVAFADEGVALRSAGISLPIMVLNVDQTHFDILIEHRLEPEIFSFSLLDQFTAHLSKRNIEDFPVHIKIDTGMHRLGFEEADLTKLSKQLSTNSHIHVRSVFSHLSSSDNPAHDAFTLRQFDLFTQTVKTLKTVLRKPFLSHIANTSAISRFPALQLDMVRVGIGMYGVDSNPNIKAQLRPVNRLTTTISQIKNVKAGEVVGYGMHKIDHNKRIATVAIGYADGYFRLLGNGKGRMMIQGKPAPTVGHVCMDMTMLDVTNIPDAQEGDEVIVFGEALPAEQVARWAGTIPYEIFTGISPRVRRIYFEEDT